MNWLEDRCVPADTIVTCPPWCAKDHDIDTHDNSGVHKMAPVLLLSLDGEVTITESFGITDGVFVNDGPAAQIEMNGTVIDEVTVRQCDELVEALIEVKHLLEDAIS